MIALYKPNTTNTGCAASFQASDRDKSLYVNLINQASWDATAKKGSFSENRGNPLKNITLKVNQAEAASIIDAIERGYSYSTVHSTPAKMTTIAFNLAEDGSRFSLNVSQKDKQDTSQVAKFFLTLTLGETRLIKEYLVHYLQKSFSKNDKNAAAPQGSEQEADKQVTEAAPANIAGDNW